nr:S24 family peptidase [Methylosinus sp. KRF6]
MVPIRDVAAAAGAGMVNHSAEVVDRLPFSRALLRRYGVNPDRAEFIRAAGDSMEPTIRSGELVLVDRSKRELRADAIYAIDLGEDVRIKRIRRNFDGSLTLISDNKALYPEEHLSSADAERLTIRGRAFLTEKVL